MGYSVGIDEVGRGPIAGPVSIGIVASTIPIDIPGLTDSKKMTARAREKVFQVACDLKEKQLIHFGVFSAPAEQVDGEGIECVLKDLIAQGLSELIPDHRDAKIYLDGRLKAPRNYAQESVIHGDLLVPIISLASVVAKVTRDSYMQGAAHDAFPHYGFDSHKGYGTRAHFDAIRQFGLSPLHRKSFLKSLVVP